ncbi:Twin-arginine translocation pathway signal [beta proteobacterium AAP121]|nr:Twin-arginine translocation pathway signal [beta proteobacterium AAP65]KPG00604.1 Twin-arginine translocation pathway signal [beta proteobacterium AAP121]
MRTFKPRRTVLGALATLAIATLALAAGPALAQNKTLKILVGFPAGGGTDAIARVLAEKLKDELGVTVIVENKPGAGGQLAAQALKNAPADGSTLFITHDHTVSVLPLVSKTPGFDPAKDFTPVAGFASFVNGFAVSPGTPAKSLAEYVAWVKASGQGKGVVGVPAPASTPEFMVKLLGGQYRLDLVPAPYRGSAPMMADMLGNQINAGIGSVPDFIDAHKAGRIRLVAVGGTARQAVLPEVPTLAELGMGGFEALPYYGFFAPAGTPKATVDAFGAALAKVLQQAEVKTRLTALGLSVEYMDAGALAARERAYTKSWAEIIRKTGFQPL